MVGIRGTAVGHVLRQSVSIKGKITKFRKSICEITELHYTPTSFIARVTLSFLLSFLSSLSEKLDVTRAMELVGV